MGNGSGITGMILGIIGTVVAIFLTLIYVIIVFMVGLGVSLFILKFLAMIMCFTSVLPGIGTIFSIIGITKNDNKVPGIIGLVTGLIGVVVVIGSVLIVGILNIVLPTILSYL